MGGVLAIDQLFEAYITSKQGHLGEESIKRMASCFQKRMGVHQAFTVAENLFLRAHHESRAMQTFGEIHARHQYPLALCGFYPIVVFIAHVASV